jgi:hypothetical protein
MKRVIHYFRDTPIQAALSHSIISDEKIGPWSYFLLKLLAFVDSCYWLTAQLSLSLLNSHLP